MRYRAPHKDPMPMAPRPLSEQRSVWIDLGLLKHNGAFRRVMLARLISLLSLGLLTVAVPYQAYQMTASSFWVGVISALEGCGMVSGLLLGGIGADAIDRRRLILYGRSACGLGFIGLAVNAWISTPSLGVLLVLSLWNGFFSGVSVTALSAAMPGLVGRSQLLQARALGMLVVRFSTIISPTLGGILIAWGHVGWNYAGAAVGTALTTWTLLGLPSLPVPPPPANGQPRRASPLGRALTSLTDGVRLVAERPVIGIFCVLSLSMATTMAIRVLFPAMVAENWANHPQALGVLLSMGPLGATGAALLSGRLPTLRRPGLWAGAFAALCAGGLLPLSAVIALVSAVGPIWSLIAVCLLLVLQGLCHTMAGLILYTVIQRLVPDHALGRVNGLWTSVDVGGGALASGALGATASLAPAGVICASLGGGLLGGLGLLAALAPGPWKTLRTLSWDTANPPQRD